MNSVMVQYDVFFSYHHADANMVERIADEVKKKANLEIWFDKWVAIPGQPFRQALEKGIDEARTCAVFVGSKTPPGWVEEEISRAIDKQVKDNSFRVIPVLLPNASMQSLRGFLGSRTCIQFTNGISDPDAVHRLICGIHGIAPGKKRAARKKADAATVETAVVDIEITINRDFKSFSEAEQSDVLKAIGLLLQVKKSVNIKHKREGSVILTLELEAAQAKLLAQAIERGDLAHLMVVSAQIIKPTEKQGAPHPQDNSVENPWLVKSAKALDEQKYEQAKQLLEQALLVNPDQSDVYNSLALLLEGHFEQYTWAREYYVKALAVDPHNAIAHNNLALLLVEHFQMHEQAKVHYEQALTIDPDYAAAHNNLAVLLRNHFNQHEQAKEHYEHALTIDYDSPITHNNLAVLLKNHFQQHKQAREHYERALTIDPAYVAAHNNLAVLLMEHFGQYDRAKEHYERALAIDPNHTTARYNLAALMEDIFQSLQKTKMHASRTTEIISNVKSINS